MSNPRKFLRDDGHVGQCTGTKQKGFKFGEACLHEEDGNATSSSYASDVGSALHIPWEGIYTKEGLGFCGPHDDNFFDLNLFKMKLYELSQKESTEQEDCLDAHCCDIDAQESFYSPSNGSFNFITKNSCGTGNPSSAPLRAGLFVDRKDIPRWSTMNSILTDVKNNCHFQEQSISEFLSQYSNNQESSSNAILCPATGRATHEGYNNFRALRKKDQPERSIETLSAGLMHHNVDSDVKVADDGNDAPSSSMAKRDSLFSASPMTAFNHPGSFKKSPSLYASSNEDFWKHKFLVKASKRQFYEIPTVLNASRSSGESSSQNTLTNLSKSSCASKMYRSFDKDLNFSGQFQSYESYLNRPNSILHRTEYKASGIGPAFVVVQDRLRPSLMSASEFSGDGRFYESHDSVDFFRPAKILHSEDSCSVISDLNSSISILSDLRRVFPGINNCEDLFLKPPNSFYRKMSPVLERQEENALDAIPEGFQYCSEKLRSEKGKQHIAQKYVSLGDMSLHEDTLVQGTRSLSGAAKIAEDMNYSTPLVEPVGPHFQDSWYSIEDSTDFSDAYSDNFGIEFKPINKEDSNSDESTDSNAASSISGESSQMMACVFPTVDDTASCSSRNLKCFDRKLISMKNLSRKIFSTSEHEIVENSCATPHASDLFSVKSEQFSESISDDATVCMNIRSPNPAQDNKVAANFASICSLETQSGVSNSKSSTFSNFCTGFNIGVAETPAVGDFLSLDHEENIATPIRFGGEDKNSHSKLPRKKELATKKYCTIQEDPVLITAYSNNSLKQVFTNKSSDGTCCSKSSISDSSSTSPSVKRLIMQRKYSSEDSVKCFVKYSRSENPNGISHENSAYADTSSTRCEDLPTADPCLDASAGTTQWFLRMTNADRELKPVQVAQNTRAPQIGGAIKAMEAVDTKETLSDLLLSCESNTQEGDNLISWKNHLEHSLGSNSGVAFRSDMQIHQNYALHVNKKINQNYTTGISCASDIGCPVKSLRGSELHGLQLSLFEKDVSSPVVFAQKPVTSSKVEFDTCSPDCRYRVEMDRRKMPTFGPNQYGLLWPSQLEQSSSRDWKLGELLSMQSQQKDWWKSQRTNNVPVIPSTNSHTLDNSAHCSDSEDSTIFTGRIIKTIAPAFSEKYTPDFPALPLAYSVEWPEDGANKNVDPLNLMSSKGYIQKSSICSSKTIGQDTRQRHFPQFPIFETDESTAGTYSGLPQDHLSMQGISSQLCMNNNGDNFEFDESLGLSKLRAAGIDLVHKMKETPYFGDGDLLGVSNSEQNSPEEIAQNFGLSHYTSNITPDVVDSLPDTYRQEVAIFPENDFVASPSERSAADIILSSMPSQIELPLRNPAAPTSKFLFPHSFRSPGNIFARNDRTLKEIANKPLQQMVKENKQDLSEVGGSCSTYGIGRGIWRMTNHEDETASASRYLHDSMLSKEVDSTCSPSIHDSASKHEDGMLFPHFNNEFLSLKGALIYPKDEAEKILDTQKDLRNRDLSGGAREYAIGDADAQPSLGSLSFFPKGRLYKEQEEEFNPKDSCDQSESCRISDSISSKDLLAVSFSKLLVPPKLSSWSYENSEEDRYLLAADSDLTNSSSSPNIEDTGLDTGLCVGNEKKNCFKAKDNTLLSRTRKVNVSQDAEYVEPAILAGNWNNKATLATVNRHFLSRNKGKEQLTANMSELISTGSLNSNFSDYLFSSGSSSHYISSLSNFTADLSDTSYPESTNHRSLCIRNTSSLGAYNGDGKSFSNHHALSLQHKNSCCDGVMPKEKKYNPLDPQDTAQSSNFNAACDLSHVSLEAERSEETASDFILSYGEKYLNYSSSFRGTPSRPSMKGYVSRLADMHSGGTSSLLEASSYHPLVGDTSMASSESTGDSVSIYPLLTSSSSRSNTMAPHVSLSIGKLLDTIQLPAMWIHSKYGLVEVTASGEFAFAFRARSELPYFYGLSDCDSEPRTSEDSRGSIPNSRELIFIIENGGQGVRIQNSQIGRVLKRFAASDLPYRQFVRYNYAYSIVEAMKSITPRIILRPSKNEVFKMMSNEPLEDFCAEFFSDRRKIKVEVKGENATFFSSSLSTPLTLKLTDLILSASGNNFKPEYDVFLNLRKLKLTETNEEHTEKSFPHASMGNDPTFPAQSSPRNLNFGESFYAHEHVEKAACKLQITFEELLKVWDNVVLAYIRCSETQQQGLSSFNIAVAKYVEILKESEVSKGFTHQKDTVKLAALHSLRRLAYQEVFPITMS